MDIQELRIDNNVVQLTGDVAVALNYAITDIAEPDKVKADFSKTIKIPGTTVINKLFNHIYDTRIDLSSGSATFDPNVKVDASYSVNNITLLDGFIRLTKINVLNNSRIQYEVNIFGKNANLFSDIGEGLLEDLDISTYDHDWTMTNQSDSWATQIQVGGSPQAFALGVGYVYPFIDYGFDNSEDEYAVEHFYPAVYAKEYWDQIFSAAGYSYNSTFLDSTYFKSLIIPYNGLGLRLSETQINNRSVIVQATAPVSQTVSSGTLDIITFDTEVQDIDNQITVPSTTITIAQSGYYDILSEFNYTGDFADTSGGAVNSMVTIKVFNQILINGVNVNSKVLYIQPARSWTGTYSTGTNPPPPSDEYSSDYSGFGTILSANNNNPASVAYSNRPYYYLENGDTVQVRVSSQLFYIAPYAGSLSYTPYTDVFEDATTPGTYYSGTITLNVEAADLRVLPVASNIVEGNAIDMNAAIPKNIKQKDFIKGIINKHNLYIQPQKDNPLVLDIEPRDDFYGSTVADWSGKLDISKDVVIEPLGALKFREFVFKDKPDKDYYNELYENTWTEIYGQRDYTLENEYLKGTKEITTIFSPTPLVGDENHDRVISEIFKTDSSNNKIQLESNIRLLYYGGLISTNQAWTHTSRLTTDITRLDHAYAGHLDDPYNPTVDLNWGLSKQIYYDKTFATVNGTINGCVNAHWYNYINEISNVNSKIVTGYFNLNASDISTLDFKKLYYFNGDYFRLQKVIDYNPVGHSLTKCVFIKFAETVAFGDPSFVINGGSGTITGGISDVELPDGRGGYVDNNVR